MLPLVRLIGSPVRRACIVVFGWLLDLPTAVATTTAAATAPAGTAAGVPAGGIIQVALGLGSVLILVGASAWLLKRFFSIPSSASGLIRIIGGTAVGQRERIILVEIADTWLVVGIAPGQMRTLHTMPKTESVVAPDAQAPADNSFANWLHRVMERRKRA